MKKTTAILLSAALIGLAASLPANASPRAEKDEQSTAQVKTAIAKLGTGPAAYVEIRLRDGTKLKGYVDSSDENSFTVMDEKSGARAVPYGLVKNVKGNNLSTGAKVAIGVGIGIVVLILIFKDHINAY